jgi:hypothetical protein
MRHGTKTCPCTVKYLLTCRWLGVDKIMLRENGETINSTLAKRMQPFVDIGFLDVEVWPGHFSQRMLGQRCSRAGYLGTYSWIGFPDIDEFIVVLEECAPSRLLSCMLAHSADLQPWR